MNDLQQVPSPGVTVLGGRDGWSRRAIVAFALVAAACGGGRKEPVAPPKPSDERQTEHRKAKETERHKAPPPEYGHDVVRE